MYVRMYVHVLQDIYLSSDTFLKTADDKHQDAIKRLDKDIEELHQQVCLPGCICVVMPLYVFHVLVSVLTF